MFQCNYEITILQSIHINYAFVTIFMLADLRRHQRRVCCGYEQRLPWYWTEEATLWISQLGLLVLRNAGMVLGIALCWCFTDGRWKLAATYCNTTRYIPLLHDSVDRPRTFYTLHIARQQHCKHHSDSGQQVSSLHDIVLGGVAVSIMKFSAVSFIWHFDLFVRVIQQTSVSDDTLRHFR